MNKISVPTDIETISLNRFDKLVRDGKIFYEEPKPEMYVDNGFEFQFQMVPMFKQKPVLPPDSSGRTKASGPFIDPDPDEVVVDLGDTHRLLVNKFCMYRPMFVIPTKEYELQTDNLNFHDIAATWSVLKAFTMRLFAIYNHGVNAGSSQGHKHTQLLPLPSHQLWPSKATSFTEVNDDIANVPFKHYVLRLHNDASAADIYEAYTQLLKLAQVALSEAASTSGDYNVIITAEWIAVIPRRTANPDGPFGANAMGMLGMIAIQDQKEREWWGRLGYSKYLTRLGVELND